MSGDERQRPGGPAGLQAGRQDTPRIIGRVEWGGPELPRTAILHAGGRWETPHQPELAATLDGRFLDDYRSMGPDQGFPGVPQLYAVADLFGGTVILEPRPPDPPGAIY